MRKDARILIISGDASTRDAARALNEFGATTVATTGIEGSLAAREQMAAQNNGFHLIVIDLASGPVDGQFALELIKGLQAVHKPRLKAKVIVAADASDRDAVFGAARYGADYCLRKPFAPERLRLKAAELLEIRVRPEMPAIRGADVVEPESVSSASR